MFIPGGTSIPDSRVHTMKSCSFDSRNSVIEFYLAKEYIYMFLYLADNFMIAKVW